MKVKYFITSMLLALFLAGCEITVADNYDTLNRADVKDVVSTVLRSQTIIEDASSTDQDRSVVIDGYLSSTYDFDSYENKLYISSSCDSIWLSQDGKRSILLKDMVYDYHDDGNEYHYIYNGTINNTLIGLVSFVTVEDFYGYNNQNPDLGSLRITTEDVTIYLDVIDEYYVDITLYDDYNNIDGITYKMSWHEVGL